MPWLTVRSLDPTAPRDRVLRRRNALAAGGRLASGQYGPGVANGGDDLAPQWDDAGMPRLPFDPGSPGAQLLRQTARRAAAWDQTIAVVAHSTSYLADEEISLEPGQRAQVPLPWAEFLVARGSAVYAP
jgi:hypothetical protein